MQVRAEAEAEIKRLEAAKEAALSKVRALAQREIERIEGKNKRERESIEKLGGLDAIFQDVRDAEETDDE